ncbi:MAG TPA: CBS domain-containing protein [Candidatus Krumholzibacteria bacterium]|nr:CBS domain-containing protein [Candidatus Krumholzibacteria bacterium]
MSRTVRRLLEHKGYAIHAVQPLDTVFRAVEAMAERGIGALLVMEGDRLVGVLSERDYARQVILRGRDSRNTAVGEIMTRDVICVEPDRDIEACMALMTEKRIRHLPVVEQGHVIGVISIGDVVRAAIDDRDFHIQQLENYIATAG